jgi:hypothetical protein
MERGFLRVGASDTTFERRFGCVTGDQNITLLHHQLKLAVRRVVDREKQHSACVFLLRQHQQR